MNDSLQTIATLSYEEALVLKSLLEGYGISSFIEDDNSLFPAMSFQTNVLVCKCDYEAALDVMKEVNNELDEQKSLI